MSLQTTQGERSEAVMVSQQLWVDIMSEAEVKALKLSSFKKSASDKDIKDNGQ